MNKLRKLTMRSNRRTLLLGLIALEMIVAIKGAVSVTSAFGLTSVDTTFFYSLIFLGVALVSVLVAFKLPPEPSEPAGNDTLRIIIATLAALLAGPALVFLYFIMI